MRMLRIFILLVIIVSSFGFVLLKIQAQSEADNFFNRNLRASFAAQPWLRQVLSLRFDGDGRSDYLGRRYQKILIEVDTMTNMTMHLGALDLLTQKIQDITGKPVSYVISDRDVPYNGEMTKDKLAKIAKLYQNHQSGGDGAVIYLLNASSFADNPDLLGLTFEENGIILFGEALRDFTKRDEQGLLLEKYEASTALHEFGHQLGLAHNEEPGCLMNEHAEEAQVVWEKPEDVVADFCPAEIEQVRNTKF